MVRIKHSLALAVAFSAAIAPAVCAQTMTAPDLTKQPTLYVVPYAHLDTQWRWDMQQTIAEYLLKTMRVNFGLMDKYPHYVFNWSGANRYRLMKEYYPADYAKMKTYVAKGQWFPTGSSMEEGDVNLPSAESIVRQVLYGNTYFRNEFGKASFEYMLPDCFGFPASLPTILAHSGVKGFSTQKLNAQWQPAPLVGGPNSPEQTPEGIPFNVGVWTGPDGESVIAALNPGNYTGTIESDISKSPEAGDKAPRGSKAEQDWPARINLDGKLTGVFADYHYVGTGDIGGATTEHTIDLLEKMATKTDGMGTGPVRIISATADQMFLDIAKGGPAMTAKMPTWSGDLELINHSAGSLTSQAYHKRWNRKNEILADAAEKASIAAEWMGARAYPKARLTDAWTLVMGGQFHDTGAGTALPRGYEFAQNDDVIAMNQFAGVLSSATQGIAAGLDTSGEGTAVVVYNSLNIAREDVVEASLPGEAKAVKVIAPDGTEVPSQVVGGKVLFLAKTPSVGYGVYRVTRAAGAAKASTLKVTANSLENARYKVAIDANGDVSSVFDKQLNRELLASPMRLAISTDTPRQWPAWNMDFDQEQAAPRAFVGGKVSAKIVENGPVRVAVEVTRETEGSKFVQIVRLSAGDAGNRVEFGESIDWKDTAANLKVVFPLSASNPNATYNWEIGTVQRPNAFDRQFEVASHHWIDLTNADNSYGATLLTDVKNASDKRDDHTLRLTLLRTPGFLPTAKNHNYSDQLNQDWGHHEIVFGLAGHANGWREAQTDWQAYRLSTPLIAFSTASHPGTLGKEFSLVQVSNPRIRILALKKAESSDEVIVRLEELDGKAAPDVTVKFAGAVTAAREVNGQELPVGSANVVGGALKTSFTPYQPRTFALKLGPGSARAGGLSSQAVSLSYDAAVSSNDDTKTVGGFDAAGNALPAEMLPTKLDFNGVGFELAPAGTGKMDAVVAKGQKIELPAGFNKVWILAASNAGDETATFHVGAKAVPLTIESWSGFVGQWDTRVWKPVPANIRQDWAVSANHEPWDVTKESSPDWSPKFPEDYVGMRAGYIKRADVAWYASHHHTAAGLNEPYEYSYLFAYPIELAAGEHTLTLPVNDKIRVLAVSVAKEEADVRPVQPLYDTLANSKVGEVVPAAK
jgi:alpha-mannosidase